MKDIKAIRDALHKIKPKGLNDFEEDAKTLRIINLKQILSEYESIAKLAKELIPLKGKDLQEALTSQAAEFYFFRICTSNLKAILDYHETLLRHVKGIVYKDTEKGSSKAYTDRAIQSLVEEHTRVFEISRDIVWIRDVLDKFYGIVEAYNQRGYSLNNLTKAIELSAMAVAL